MVSVCVGFADPRPAGVVGGVVWCVCIRVRVRRSKTGLSHVALGVSWAPEQDLFKRKRTLLLWQIALPVAF